jgi:hypothetical protein
LPQHVGVAGIRASSVGELADNDDSIERPETDILRRASAERNIEASGAMDRRNHLPRRGPSVKKARSRDTGRAETLQEKMTLGSKSQYGPPDLELLGCQPTMI